MKRYIVFCRVSTPMQVDNGKKQGQRELKWRGGVEDSLDVQERICRRMITETLEGEVVKVFQTQKSGRFYYSSENLMTAMEMLESKEADGIVFYDFSRFSRNEYYKSAVRRIRRSGAELHFVRNMFPGGADGEMQMGHTAVASMYQAEKQRELLILYLREYARDGIQMARGAFPFGYKIIQEKDVIRGSKLPAGTYVIESEEKAGIAKEIFKMRSRGKKLREIAEWLDGTIKPSGGAKHWATATVHNILHNSVYMGQGVYGRKSIEYDEDRARDGHPGSFKVWRQQDEWIYIPAPRIVTPALWMKAQKVNSRLGRPRKVP